MVRYGLHRNDSYYTQSWLSGMNVYRSTTQMIHYVEWKSGSPDADLTMSLWVVWPNWEKEEMSELDSGLLHKSLNRFILDGDNRNLADWVGNCLCGTKIGTFTLLPHADMRNIHSRTSLFILMHTHNQFLMKQCCSKASISALSNRNFKLSN